MGVSRGEWACPGVSGCVPCLGEVGGVSQCQELQDYDTGHSQAERQLVDELDLDGEGTIINFTTNSLR
jgi:hypothetical protein